MFSLSNLGGTVMLGDEEILEFKFKKDQFQYCRQLCFDRVKLPFEFENGDFSEKAIRNFWYYRIVPDTRQGLIDILQTVGIQWYDPETIIRYQKGRTLGDKYWLREDEDGPGVAFKSTKSAEETNKGEDSTLVQLK